MKFPVTALIAALLLNAADLNGQTLPPIAIKGMSAIPNAIGVFSLSIDIELDINSDEILDDEHLLAIKDSIKFHLLYSGKANPNKECLKVNLFVSKTSVGFRITGFNNASINQFLAKDNQISIEVDKDIPVQLLKSDSGTVSRTGVIKKDDINKMITENLSITDDERTSYVTYLNNFFYFQNKLDFGIEPSMDSSSTSYFLAFQMQNRYDTRKFFKCDAAEQPKNPPHFFWNLNGRVSTDFSDSLNYINFYPINVQFNSYSKHPYELNFKVGNEANQTFSNKRVVVDGSYSFMLPNFVPNLTTASSNRLRFKPVVIAGIKGYHDYSNNTEHFSSGQAYVTLHYYIPVANNYAIIIDENPFFDFSKKTNPNQRLANQYSIIVGAEIPSTGFKAMFKYVNGKSDINLKQGEIIGIGLLMDFFQEKEKKNKQ
jgi:hypothetical protein